MYQFKKIPNKPLAEFIPKDTVTITHEIDTVDLNELLEEFEFFLKGCGFNFNGHLEIIEEELTDN